jgi:vanadium chloroperoxidase
MADPILDWNAVALEANRVSHTNGKQEQTGPTLSARALAIVHLAMYDAFIGADAVGTNPSGLGAYLEVPVLTAVAGASPSAAVAGAAHETLSALFPSQKAYFDFQLGLLLADLPNAGLQDGLDFGRKVGKRLLVRRKDDPPANDVGYAPPSPARGGHRPDPDNPGQGFHGPFFGTATCFACTTRFSLDPPFALDSAEYAAALEQVRNKGIASELMGRIAPGADRTSDETVRGIYWACDGPRDIGTPPRLYNRIVRTIAKNVSNPNNADGAVNTPVQNADLFARVNAAMGDAAILAWADKFKYNLWRPVLGIREHDLSMGSNGTPGNALDPKCDSSWLPLGAPMSNSPTMEKNFTPPFPAYPSGHATFGAAAFHITRLCYDSGLLGNTGPDTLFAGLSFVSDELDGINRDNKGVTRPRHVRSFDDGGLWQMIEENGYSRVDLGVHWVFDAFALDGDQPDLTQNIGGVRLGYDIAEDIHENGLHAAAAAGPDAAAEALAATAVAPVVPDSPATRKPWPLG